MLLALPRQALAAESSVVLWFGLFLFYSYSLGESQPEVEHLMAKCHCQIPHDYILNVNKYYLMWANVVKYHPLKLSLYDHHE